MTTSKIDWNFQPARTPHFGGAHESLVRVTKKALYAALEQEARVFRHPIEDMLRTLLFEVAAILNGRRPSYVSSDPDDFCPLTQNDFLNRPPSADLPAGDFTTATPREHYRYIKKWRRCSETYGEDLFFNHYPPGPSGEQKNETYQ